MNRRKGVSNPRGVEEKIKKGRRPRGKGIAISLPVVKKILAESWGAGWVEKGGPGSRGTVSP